MRRIVSLFFLLSLIFLFSCLNADDSTNSGINGGIPTPQIDGSLDNRGNSTIVDLDDDFDYPQSSSSNSKDTQMADNSPAGVDGGRNAYCKNIPALPNGSINGNLERSESSTFVQYTCNEGYVDMGNGMLTCDGANWSPFLSDVCKKTCPQLHNSLELIDTPADDDPAIGFPPETRARFRCLEGYRPVFQQDLLACDSSGSWKLIDDSGSELIKVRSENDLCASRFSQFSSTTCPHLPSKPGLKIRYKFVDDDSGGMFSIGDEAFVSCSQPNYFLQSRERVFQLVIRCLPGGRWSQDISALNCVSYGCTLPPSNIQLRPVYEQFPSDPLSHRTNGTYASVVNHGVKIFYQCHDPQNYYLVGEREYVCTVNGTWMPPYWPRCERKQKCLGMQFPADGYYTTDQHLDGFEPGHVLNFGCAAGFRLEGRPELECLESGEWNSRPPTCLRDDWTTKRFIAVTTIACLLGVLFVVMLGFFLQRQCLLRKALGSVRRHRLLDSRSSEPRLRFPSLNSGVRRTSRHHHLHAQSLAAAARTGPAAFDSDPDRLALIAFADGVQVPLPSYEEAVNQAINERRCHPPPFDAISTLSGYCSRAVRRLPSLSSLRSSREAGYGNAVADTRSAGTHISGDSGNGRQLSELREQWSSTSGSNVSSQSHERNSRQVGSNDTVAISDASTNITLETVSSGGHSQTASARAYAGSLSSMLSSTGVGLPTSIPVMTLSVCSASSSVGSSNTAATSALGGSQSDDLPLLESQELDVNQEDYEPGEAISNQQEQAVGNGDEISSQKSLSLG